MQVDKYCLGKYVVAKPPNIRQRTKLIVCIAAVVVYPKHLSLVVGVVGVLAVVVIVVVVNITGSRSSIKHMELIRNKSSFARLSNLT